MTKIKKIILSLFTLIVSFALFTPFTKAQQIVFVYNVCKMGKTKFVKELTEELERLKNRTLVNDNMRDLYTAAITNCIKYGGIVVLYKLTGSELEFRHKMNPFEQGDVYFYYVRYDKENPIIDKYDLPIDSNN